MRLGVVPARLGMMMFGMAGMSMSGVSVMRRLLVIAGLMVLCRFMVVLGGLLVMLGGLLMVLSSLVHVSSRSDSCRYSQAYAGRLTGS